MTNNTPHSYRLDEFVAGELNDTENTIITEHVADCEACLTYLDNLWATSEFSWDEADIPHLEPHSIYNLERRLFRQIHRSSLGANTILLGTRGIFDVLFALIKPFFQLKENKSLS